MKTPWEIYTNKFYLIVESVYNNNFMGSPTKEMFSMDPMLEHALDFDTDENEEKE